jgi:hypothetical protein
MLFITAIAAATLWASACHATDEKAASNQNAARPVIKAALPMKTSLGDLVKIENRNEVKTDKETISPKATESLYVFSFEGKKKIEFKGDKSADPNSYLYLPLIDPTGHEFVPVFAGSAVKDGVLSKKGIDIIGEFRIVRGAKGLEQVPTGVGEIWLPEPKLTLVYLVPKEVSGLALKDGEQRFQIN